MDQDVWDPERYARFGRERRQPFFDLVDLVRVAPDMDIVDLGCGTGELTRQLHERLGARSTVGVERSSAMLARSREHVAPGLTFRQDDIGCFEPEGALDLVFSNAALHWLDDHAGLLPRLVGWLHEGGQLAVQVPSNHGHVSHLVAAEVAAREPFASALGGWVRTSPVLPVDAYALGLHALGVADQRVFERVYLHELSGRDHVVDWMRGTTLTAYESRLDPALYASFVSTYTLELTARLPDQRPFPFPFRRTFLWARTTPASSR